MDFSVALYGCATFAVVLFDFFWDDLKIPLLYAFILWDLCNFVPSINTTHHDMKGSSFLMLSDAFLYFDMGCFISTFDMYLWGIQRENKVKT